MYNTEWYIYNICILLEKYKYSYAQTLETDTKATLWWDVLVDFVASTNKMSFLRTMYGSWIYNYTV